MRPILSAMGSLHAVDRPHHLGSAIGQRNLCEELAAWIIDLEGAMIRRVPVSRKIHMLVAGLEVILSAYLFDYRENLLIVCHLQRTTGTEIVLNVDYDQCSDFITCLCLFRVFFDVYVFAIGTTHF